MSREHDYALSDFTASTGNRTISSRSRISSESHEGPPQQNPFVDQPENQTDNLSFQPYDGASGNLLSGQKMNEQPHAQGHAYLREWMIELIAWLVAATSLASMIILFIHYEDEPLRQWKTQVTPATTVAILSQIGQTAILAPVTACICQSMWLWLDKESRATHQAQHNPRLIMMQKYDDSSRGPISSLLLLWKRPDALLVWLGTVSTLLIIIFGAFAQQSLQLPTREFNVTGINFIPRTLQYSAARPGVNATRETALETHRLGQTLWIGASDFRSSVIPNYNPLEPNTLIRFYVIYVKDLDIWSGLDYTKVHKDELVALQVTLSLCLNKYHTDMTFGVTNTTLLGSETDLEWHIEDAQETSFEKATVTHNAETFWMNVLNRLSFYKYFSLQVFTGSASWSPAEGPGANLSESDIVRKIAASIYEDPGGIQSLSRLLDNLAVSMSNALRTTTDRPDNHPGTSSSFQVYIEIEWAWMIVPIAALILSLAFLLLTIYLSRQSKILAWKSSLLAVLLSLNSETRAELGAIRRPKEMEEMAKVKNVRLEANGGQWQIVKAD
ncbi:MAG: hypothetical protein Q9226_006159 [Calogaya cf. arnoldii]